MIRYRSVLLRSNAVFLLAASGGGLLSDLAGAFLARGPVSRVLNATPHTAIGFVEAHGLALIFGVLLWRAQPSPLWHATAAGIHVLLGSANLLFWPIFPAADMLALGYITTILHGAFALLQFFAAADRPRAAHVQP